MTQNPPHADGICKRTVPAQLRMVSIIIPTLNEEAVIGECLQALVDLEFARDRFEVIVVDNGSTDRTLAITGSFQAVLDLKIFAKERCYVSALRNFAAASAKGEVLAFLDADCIVPRRWLYDANELFALGNNGIVGAYYKIPEQSSWVAKAWYQTEHEKSGLISYVPSGDLLIQRNVFLRIGGFDETLETNEDYEFCQRVSAAGLPVLSAPQLSVVHLGTPQTVSHFFRRQRWHGKHVFAVFLRNISRFPNARAVAFAVYVLLCVVGGITGAAITAISGYYGVLIFSATAFVAAPLLLALRAAAKEKRWASVLPRTLLFVAFGLARALCLVDFKAWWGEASSRPVNLPLM